MCDVDAGMLRYTEKKKKKEQPKNNQKKKKKKGKEGNQRATEPTPALGCGDVPSRWETAVAEGLRVPRQAAPLAARAGRSAERQREQIPCVGITESTERGTRYALYEDATWFILQGMA